MKLITKLSSLSLPKTLALWGVTVVGYSLAYLALSSMGHAAIIEGTTLTAGMGGFFDALYYSALHALSVSAATQPSLLVDALGKSQLALSAGFFGLFIHKSAKAAAPFQRMQYPTLHHHLTRIISKLYIFRYDISKLLESLDSGTLTRHHMKDLWITTSGVDTAMIELHEIVMHHFPSPQDTGSQEKLLREDLFKRVIAAVDSSFWNLSCLIMKCSNHHIKWNYEQNLESVLHNTMLAEEIISTLAQYPLGKETLYSLREVQKTFIKLNRQIREKEDLGFDEIPLEGIDEALGFEPAEEIEIRLN